MKMRLVKLILLLVAIKCVVSKNNVKSLTESMGQEIIEIGAPIKDLPPDVEEEPSIENDDDEKFTTTTIQAGTKKDIKKTTTSATVDGRRKNKEVEKNLVGEKLKADEEEARIEKELAEIYKDNVDYKADSSEVAKDVSSPQKLNKPIGRARANFKFQPDVNSRAEIEKFRTSVDEISCGKARLSGSTVTPLSGSGGGGNNSARNDIHFIIKMIPLAFIIAFK